MGGRRLAARSLSGAIAAATFAAVAISAEGQSAALAGPSLLRGAPLGNNTGLRLLVADNPPFVLDVDRNRATPLRDIPTAESRTLSVVGVGGHSGVIVDVRAPGCRIRKACLYAVRGRGGRITPLGAGRNVASAADGRSVWLQSSSGDSLCVVRQVRLDGRQLRARRPFPCSWGLDPAGSSGLIVRRNGDRVIDPVTGRVSLEGWGIAAVGSERILTECSVDRCSLLDIRSGTRRGLFVNSLGRLLAPAVDPHSRFVALSLGLGSWGDSRGTNQVLDVWVVDLETGKRTQLPGMPIYAAIKRTSGEWTSDGRLVILGEVGVRSFVAVWKPGERRLRVKGVKLPQRTSGSASFAVLG